MRRPESIFSHYEIRSHRLFLANKEKFAYVQASAMYCNWNSEYVPAILNIRDNLEVLASWTDTGNYSTSEQLNPKLLAA
jgi:hypothetical protein